MSVRTEMIDYPSDGHTTPAYLARPDDAAGHPGVVVIQEWWGLVPHIKDVAGRFAEAGYVALAPDLYYGESAEEPDEARKLAMALDRPRAVAEIVAAAKHLKGLDAVMPKKVGVVGWCMGGGLTLSAAARGAGQFDAAVAFYGMPLDPADMARIDIPLLGLYAEHDHGVTPERLDALRAALDASGVPHEIHLYPGTQHAFFNDTRPTIHNAEAAKDAWKRTLAWFGEYLR